VFNKSINGGITGLSLWLSNDLNVSTYPTLSNLNYSDECNIHIS